MRSSLKAQLVLTKLLMEVSGRSFLKKCIEVDQFQGVLTSKKTSIGDISKTCKFQKP